MVGQSNTDKVHCIIYIHVLYIGAEYREQSTYPPLHEVEQLGVALSEVGVPELNGLTLLHLGQHSLVRVRHLTEAVWRGDHYLLVLAVYISVLPRRYRVVVN